MSSGTVPFVATLKPIRSGFLIHPVTELLVKRLARHYRNSVQGVLEYCVEQYDPDLPVQLPDGTKSMTLRPSLSQEIWSLLAGLSERESQSKSEIIRRAIHQRGDAKGLSIPIHGEP